MANAKQDGLVTIFGASGFLGRHVTRALAKRGWRVRAAVRRPDLAFHLQPLGGVGQIHAVQANLRYPETITAAVAGADVVVNLVGLLFESGKQKFDKVMTEGAGAVSEAAASVGARMVHASALGCDVDTYSNYARAKLAGEEKVLDASPDAVIVRPSVVFGPEDNFFNLFAALARFSPVMPLIGGGQQKFQPVFVGDVAEAIARAVDGEAKAGTVYELGGPEVKTFEEIQRYICEVTRRTRIFAPVPYPIAELQAMFLSLLPTPLLTHDQLQQLHFDNVVSQKAVADGRTLAGLGIQPTTINAIVPSYLWRFRKGGQFDKPREA